MTIDFADIQGLVYAGYSEHPYAAYVFATLTDGCKARAWLARMIPEISSAAQRANAPGDRVNLALSAAALAKLGVPTTALAGLAEEATLGMHDRTRVLGDRASSTWQLGSDGTLDVLVMIFTRDEARREALLAEHKTALVEAGAALHADEVTCALTPREHFGFPDGVSQPFMPGRGEPPAGVTPIALGEILLGYENAYQRMPASPRWDGFDLGKNGTYLVFRKLEQHVGAFWRYLVDQARQLAPGDPVAATELADVLAAKLVGRWRESGTSLVLAPERDDPAHAENNTFGYLAEDPDGARCPIGSHVRRANPRDARGGSATESLVVANRHRILRRGRSYGPPLTWTDAITHGDDGKARGLYFISLQASIARGFEFIQQTWLSNPGFAGLFCEPDPLVGNGDGTAEVTIPSRPLRLRLRDIPSVVTVHGGGYFLLPSLTALSRIAAI